VPRQKREPETIIRPVAPIQIVNPVIIRHDIPVRSGQPPAPKTIQVPAPNNSREEPRQTVPTEQPSKNPEKNSESIPNNSERIPEPAQNASALNMPEIEEGGEVGRKRKYDDTGIYGDISIKDVVLFRYIKERHFPDLSQDMRDWYEHFYFTAPVVGESPYRGRDYEQHKRAYERGQRWIREYDARQASHAGDETLGNSGAAIIPFPGQRANG
jgi:hypothetical protein